MAFRLSDFMMGSTHSKSRKAIITGRSRAIKAHLCARAPHMMAFQFSVLHIITMIRSSCHDYACTMAFQDSVLPTMKSESSEGASAQRCALRASARYYGFPRLSVAHHEVWESESHNTGRSRAKRTFARERPVLWLSDSQNIVLFTNRIIVKAEGEHIF